MHSDNTFSALAEKLINNYIDAPRSRANRLIITLYGDTVCPYGGTVWLGSLIRLLEPLGINDRLVRTSVYRLSEQNILSSQQQGRRSYYTLTPRGTRQFENAARRIYAPGPPDWDGTWRMVFTQLSTLTPPQHDALRKELLWLGFSALHDGLYVHPTLDNTTLQALLEDRGIQQQVAFFNALPGGNAPAAASSNQLMTGCFDTTHTDTLYAGLINTYRPLLAAAQHSAPLTPQYCFLVRTLLIHQYRYILLREPELPLALLPEQATSLRARQLVRQLYQLLTPQSDAYFLRMTESDNGYFERPPEAYYLRFATERT